MSRNSRTASWASFTAGSLYCVWTFESAATGVEHDVISLRWPSTLT